MQAVESNVSRRRLLGSALTLGAGAAIGSTMSYPSLGVPLAAAGRKDLVHDELIRQLKTGVRGMRAERPAEAARSVAATLRILAAHYQATDQDAAFKTRLKQAVGRHGRDAVLRWEPDAAMLAAEAREFGVTGALPKEPFNLADRERALDALLKNGAAPVLLAAAAEISRRASQLDRMGVSPIAARQCPNVGGFVLSLEFITAVACLANPIFCAAFGGALFGLKLSLYLAGC
jgi:hypothetical protein